MGKQPDQPPSEAYEAPELRVLGSVEELTLALAVGGATDLNFGANTPIELVTVS